VRPVAVALMLDGAAALAAHRPTVWIRAARRPMRLLTVVPERLPARRHRAAARWLHEVLGADLAAHFLPEPSRWMVPPGALLLATHGRPYLAYAGELQLQAACRVFAEHRATRYAQIAALPAAVRLGGRHHVIDTGGRLTS